MPNDKNSSQNSRPSKGPIRKSPGKALRAPNYFTPNTELTLAEQKSKQLQAWLAKRLRKMSTRSDYVADGVWGMIKVHGDLPADPGPIISPRFKPWRGWLPIYRTNPASPMSGTHNITVGDIRAVIGSFGTSVINPFVLHRLHIWIAPNVVNTHFEGLLITYDDRENGLLGGSYTDMAPYGKFVRFGVGYPGEGSMHDGTVASGVNIFGVGGSAAWNAVVYADISTYD